MGKKLSEMLEQMESAMGRNDLSDEYLAGNGCATGKRYGALYVSCEWVYPYLKALCEDPDLSDIVRRIESGGA